MCFFCIFGGVTLLLIFHRVLAKKEPSRAPLCHSAPVLCIDLEYVQGWKINLLSRSKTELGDSLPQQGFCELSLLPQRAG